MLFDRVKSTSKKRALGVLVVAACILVLEVFGFNYQFWSTCTLQEEAVSVERVSVGDAGVGDGADVGDAGAVMGGGAIPGEATYAANLDGSTSVSTILVNAGDGVASCAVYATDAGHSVPYVLAELEPFRPGFDSPLIVHPYGEVDSLTIVPADASGTVEGLVVNRPVPFSFSFIRVLLAAVIAAFAFVFRVKSKVYAVPLLNNGRVAVCALVAAALGLSLVFTGASFVNRYMVGTIEPTQDGYDYAYPAEQDYYAQYGDLAKAMAQGSLSLLYEPPSELQQLDNPYDIGERARMTAETGVTARWDTAYHDGKYYVYFGVLPVILFYLPWYLATGTNFPNIAAFDICMVAFIVGVGLLLMRIARRWFPILM